MIDVLPDTNAFVIGKLRTRASALDGPSLQLRLTRMFAAVDLRPSVLPPCALLCVRAFRPPRSIVIGAAHGQNAFSSAWIERARGALEDVARRAARPARGFVPANAVAVVFADRSELLACLARDWVSGIAPTQWWWRTLFQNQDTAAAIREAWIKFAQFTPAALEHLASKGEATRFVRALGAGTARMVLEEILRVHAISTFSFEGIEATALTQASELAVERPANRSPLYFAVPDEVRRWVPEALEPALSAPQRALLAVGLLLHRAPAQARTRAFISALDRWLSSPALAPHREASSAVAERAGGTHEASEGDAQRSSIHSSLDTVPTIEETIQPARVESDERAAAPARMQRGDTPQDQGIRINEPQRPERLPVHRSLYAVAPKPEQSAAYQSSLPDVAQPNAVATSQLAPDIAVPAPIALHGLSVDTGFGGLFYLMNAGIFLGLYGDFTSPAKPGIELPIWDFLALAVEDLCGSRVEADAVWPLLARLAGRLEDEPPGARFQPPAEWRIPKDWLAPFAHRRGSWRWHADARRLTVRHPAGFTVLDVRRDNSSAARQVQREMRAYRERFRFRLRAVATPRDAPRANRLARWRQWVMPYVARRLTLGLGLRGLRRAARLLVSQPARIEISAARLDIHFHLARLPLQVRLAGLDRDPGWVPAAGRCIAFHYE